MAKDLWGISIYGMSNDMWIIIAIFALQNIQT